MKTGNQVAIVQQHRSVLEQQLSIFEACVEDGEDNEGRGKSVIKGNDDEEDGIAFTTYPRWLETRRSVLVGDLGRKEVDVGELCGCRCFACCYSGPIPGQGQCIYLFIYILLSIHLLRTLHLARLHTSSPTLSPPPSLVLPLVDTITSTLCPFYPSENGSVNRAHHIKTKGWNSCSQSKFSNEKETCSRRKVTKHQHSSVYCCSETRSEIVQQSEYQILFRGGFR